MSADLMFKREILGIVVTYHPDAEFAARLSLVSPQVDALVIVDNCSADMQVQMLRQVAAQSDCKIHLVLNNENFGIARALNIGVQQAISLGYSWALLLDQDSSVNSDMVVKLFLALDSFPQRDRLAVIGSGKFEARGDIEVGALEQRSSQWIEVEAVITSGSLLSLVAYSVVGPFREEFFIDHVDNEYCLRARAKGYRIINSRVPLMSHAIGSPTLHTVFGKSKLATNHSADRRYYFARNDTVLLRESGRYKRGAWMIKSLSRRVRTIKRIILFETSKRDKIVAVVHGWWDGTRGRMGPRAKTTRPNEKSRARRQQTG